ncbi:hypothetical protein BIV60_21540 [Bacillus sp. MUM 116]|uniref:hypothetical protein n=1 Tax=Bacillus sp. MUM 116 TaxID=1678002 RepID=UPI0008F5D9DE|nr:hypothetical protein [Bacillus sp. MUM 116]OIK10334.1 hypothetical protein BIV60_21540 [Bacillus sp. MUM 116]
MSDEPQGQPQEQPQETFQESRQTLKNEIKNELKAEFSNFRQKSKRRFIYSVCIFALGVMIGFGGGRVTHFDHHAEHDHIQKWHHKQK